MDLKKYIDENQKLYQDTLEYIENELNNDDDQIQNNVFSNQTIKENKENLDSFLRLLSNISNNHYRSTDFFTKIEFILKSYKLEIQQFLSNSEIFNIFKNNKRILLLLFEIEIIKFDESIILTFIKGWYKNAKYPFYFYPEIKQFLDEKVLIEISSQTNEMEEVNSENFERNRKLGQNHHFICKLIQNDDVKDFIVYINQTNYSLSSKINSSIFETNEFLINKNVSLIEYAAFFGSIQIFQFLYMNQCVLNGEIWTYSIHGRHPEIIHLLENNDIIPNDKKYTQCFLESVKCHHNEIANYIQDNLLSKQNNFQIGIKYFNYDFYPNETIDEIGFYFACKYNNPFLVKYILENTEIDVNTVFYDGQADFYQTALCAACKEGNQEIVKLLLQQPNIDVNSKSILYNYTTYEELVINFKKQKYCLHIAVEQGYEEIVKLLLSHPDIDVNIQMEYHEYGNYIRCHCAKSALLIAVEKQNAKIVELLLSHPQINVNQISNHNDSDYILPEGHDRYIEQIPLIIAVEKENVEIVSLLLNHSNIMINIKSRCNNYKYQEHFGYCSSNYKERTPLSIAIEKKNVKIVKLLLDCPKIDVNCCLQIKSCTNEDENNFKTNSLFYQNDFDHNDDEININYYIERNYDKNQILERFDDIKFKNNYLPKCIEENKPILFIAIESQDAEIVRFLMNSLKIQSKCILMIKEKGKKESITPLQHANKLRNNEIYELLKENERNRKACQIY